MIMMASRRQSQWRNEDIKVLIKAVRSVPFIYDPADKSHKDALNWFWAFTEPIAFKH